MVGRWFLAVALCLVFPPVPPTKAQDGPKVRATLEQVQAHRRVALGYLQTGNADLALVELDRLNDLAKLLSEGRLWIQMEPALAAAFAGAQATVEQSIKAAESGDLDRARDLLIEGSGRLDAWRREVGLTLFSDCIAEAGSAYEALDTYRRHRPDLSDPAIRLRIDEAAAATEQALARCDAEAPPILRAEPEFRRLMDGFVASLKIVSDAVAKQDGDYLYRLLIEQRAFERLLAFRFG